MKPELLFVEQHGELGGGQRILLSLALSDAVRQRWEPRFALAERGAFWTELEASAIPVDLCPAPRMSNGPKRLSDVLLFATGFWGQVRWFRRAVQQHPVEFVYTSSPRFLAQLVLACAGTRTSVVFHLQAFYESCLEERFLAAALGSARVALVICPSVAAEAWVHILLSPSKPRVTVSNWLCAELTSAPGGGRAESVRLDTVARDQFHFGVVGRLVRIKGQDLFLDAARRLLAQGVRAEFYVIGGEIYASQDGYASALRAMHADEPRIHFVGYTSRMESVYQQLSCVVVPSRSEVFGLVAVEAMYHGVPVIVSDVAELPRIVDGGRCGLVFRSESVEELAAAMRRMLEDRPLRARLIEQGRRQVEENYRAEPCTGRIAEALERARRSPLTRRQS